MIAYGGPSTVNTEVHAFRVLSRYLTHIVGTKISFGNRLIIPLVTGEGMTNKKEHFQVLMVARELVRGDRISESMEAINLSVVQWHRSERLPKVMRK